MSNGLQPLKALTSKGKTVWFTLGIVLVFGAGPASAIPIDLSVTDIFGMRTIGSGGDNNRIPGFAPPIKDGRVGFTFSAQAQNVGSDPIPWGWPVREAAAPFTGASEGFKGAGAHAHNAGLPIALNTGHEFFGPHPHIGRSSSTRTGRFVLPSEESECPRPRPLGFDAR